MAQQKIKLNQDTLDRIERKIIEIKNASEGGEYICRGEAKRHREVCSGLYREYVKHMSKDKEENYDVAGSQTALLDKLNAYLHPTKNEDNDAKKNEDLAQLQHYEAKTNLIDFTPDHLIALYFACDKETESDGRVILIQRPKDKKDEEKRGYKVIDPPEILERIKSQQSVFVESSTGVIKLYDVVIIPKDLKEDILTYLDNEYNITREFIYKDIHGFIKSKDIKIQYLELHKGKQEIEKQLKHKKYEDRNFSKAIDYCEIALKIKPEFPEAYSELGQTYFLQGQTYSQQAQIYAVQYENDKSTESFTKSTESFTKSIENFNKAIKYDPENADHYRGIAQVFAHCDKSKEAVEYYSKAIEKNENESYFYNERCKNFMKMAEQDERIWEDVISDINTLKERSEDLNSIKDFVKREKINLPNDVRIILRLPQQED